MEAKLYKITDFNKRDEQNFTENDKQNVKKNESDIHAYGECVLRALDTKIQEHNPNADEHLNQSDIDPNTTVEDIQDNEQSAEQKYRQDDQQQHIYIDFPDHNQEIEEGGNQVRDIALNGNINNKDDEKQTSSEKFGIEIATEESSLVVLVNQQNNQNAKQDDLLDDKLVSEKLTDNKIEKDDQNVKIKNHKNVQLSQRLHESSYLEDSQEYDAEDEEEDEDGNVASGGAPTCVQESIQANFPEHKDDGNSLCAIDFKISCQLPAALFLKYTKARAEQYHLTGWIEEFSEGHYKGHFEGSSANVSKVPQILKEFHNFRSQIKKSTFGAVHKILELSCRNFEIKSISDTNS